MKRFGWLLAMLCGLGVWALAAPQAGAAPPSWFEDMCVHCAAPTEIRSITQDASSVLTVIGHPLGRNDRAVETCCSARLRQAADLVAPNTPTMFRGDTRLPEVIFEQGFQPWGDDLDLLRHANAESIGGSGFVSTSRSSSAAAEPPFGGNLFEVQARGGIDVNDSLSSMSPYPFVFEVAFPGGIPARCVVGCTLPSGEWVPNPVFGGP